jgi:hypothetical protein
VASSVSGIVRPSALTVLRLITTTLPPEFGCQIVTYASAKCCSYKLACLSGSINSVDRKFIMLATNKQVAVTFLDGFSCFYFRRKPTLTFALVVKRPRHCAKDILTKKSFSQTFLRRDYAVSSTPHTVENGLRPMSAK